MRASYLNQRSASSAMLISKIEEIIQAIMACGNSSRNPFSRRSDILLFVNFIQENKLAFSPERRSTNAKELGGKLFCVNESSKARFIAILGRMAKAHEGISRQERLFLHQFWSEFQEHSSI